MSEKHNPFAIQKREEGTKVLQEAHQAKAIQEVQAALVIAKQFPRDERKAMDRIITACMRPSLAEKAIYTYAKGGTDIEGPSIRLAEAIAQSWGNMDFGIRELEQRDGESVVEAYAWDQETNTRQTKQFTVPHSRYTKRGSYKLEDPREIYETVANQGARRLRACVIGIIPADVIDAAVAQCNETMAEHEAVTPERIAKMLSAFEWFGVTKAQIEKRIQRRMDAITPALMANLRKIYNSLKDGMSQPAEWFDALPATEPEAKGEDKSGAKAKTRAEELAAKIAAEKGVAKSEPASDLGLELDAQAERES